MRRADELALKFQRSRRSDDAAALWAEIAGYYWSLQGLSMMQGYHVREVVGDAFCKMRDAAIDYNPVFGVAFVLYFRMRLHGMLRAMRVSERQRSAPLVGQEAAAGVRGAGEEEDMALVRKLLRGLSGGGCVKRRVAKAYVEAYVCGEKVTGPWLAARAGVPYKELRSVLDMGVSSEAADLIL